MTLQLKIDNLSGIRGNQCLFSKLSMQLESGQAIKIEGENGAGKTTLLRLISGLASIEHGDISWCGQSIRHARSDYYQQMLYLGHLPGTKQLLSPLENLRWWCGLHLPCENSDELILSALEQVQLSAYVDTPCAYLSAGQQRRIALARLFLDKRSLWLLDEPLSAIDKDGVLRLERQMEQHLDRGGMIVLTTHQALQSNRFQSLQLEAFQNV